MSIFRLNIGTAGPNKSRCYLEQAKGAMETDYFGFCEFDLPFLASRAFTLLTLTSTFNWTSITDI